MGQTPRPSCVSLVVGRPLASPRLPSPPSGFSMQRTDLPRRADRQIWITRSHLMALGVANLCVAALAFLVGIQVGRRGAEEPSLSAAATATFLPDPTQEDALEALLREVEYAQSAITPSGQAVSNEKADHMVFPEVLTGEVAIQAVTPTEPPTPEAVSVEPRPETAPEGDVPAVAGWSVQIASYPTLAEAEAKMNELSALKLQPFRVAALVNGVTWFRVRVGGYPDRKAAEAARGRLSAKLGASDLLVASAP